MTIDEGTCQICNRDNPVWFAENELWNTYAEEFHFLCPSCFIARCAAAGYSTIWQLSDSKASSLIPRHTVAEALAALRAELREIVATPQNFSTPALQSAIDREIDATIAELGLNAAKEESK